MGLELYPFQKTGVEYLLSRKRALLADEMGTGKSAQALGLINADPKIRSVLIVCPAHLKLNWEIEARQWLRGNWKICIPDRDGYDMLADLVIVNHERIIGKHGKELHEQLAARSWDLLIVDEAHYLKSSKASRTIAVLGSGSKKNPSRGLVDSADRVVFLTGTPILNRPRELWTLLEVLAPGKFGSWVGYRIRYCGARQEKIWTKDRSGRAVQRTIWIDDGASNLQELGEKLRATCMLRRMKKDVLPELPEKITQLIVIPAPKGTRLAGAVARERKLYEQQKFKVDAAIGWVGHMRGKHGYEKAVKALGQARQVAFSEISKLRHEVALSKIRTVADHVCGILQEGQSRVLVFTHHKAVAHGIAEEITSSDVGNALPVTGGHTVQQRQEMVGWFQDAAKTENRVLVATIGALGTGHTLTAASVVVFAELDWVPAAVAQAADRAHRIGQKNTVLVQHLVLEGSLDVKIAKMILSKQGKIDQVLEHEPIDIFGE